MSASPTFREALVKIATSTGITLAVLALTIAVRPMDAQRPAPAAAPAASSAAADTLCVPVEVLKKSAGTYDFNIRAGPVEIMLKGDQPGRKMAGQPDYVLTPISQTKFKMGTTPLTVEFVLDESGAVTQVFGADNRWTRAQRTK